MGLCLVNMMMEAGTRVEAIPGVEAEVEVVVLVAVEGEGMATMALLLTTSKMQVVTIEAHHRFRAHHHFKAVVIPPILLKSYNVFAFKLFDIGSFAPF